MEAALNKLLNNRSVFHRFLILFWPFFGVWPFSHPFSSKASFCCHVANALAPCEPFLPRTRFGTGSTCCAVTCNWLDSQPYWKARYVSPANHIKFSTVMLCQRIDESAGRAPHSSNGRKAVDRKYCTKSKRRHGDAFVSVDSEAEEQNKRVANIAFWDAERWRR